MGETYIANVIPGFGAIKSGLIAVQDVLLTIDYCPVETLSLDETKARTIGTEVKSGVPSSSSVMSARVILC